MEYVNIDASGIEVRLRRAVILFAVTVAGYVVALRLSASPLAYLPLLIPLFLTTSLLYQALFKT